MFIDWITHDSKFNSIMTSDTKLCIANDNDGFVYLAYCTAGIIGSSTPNTNVRLSICKLNRQGDFVWGRTYSTSEDSNYNNVSMKYDNDGNLVLAFEMTGTIDILDDIGDSASPRTQSGIVDVIVMKILCTTGDVLWKIQSSSFNTHYINKSPRIDIDEGGNLYVCITHFEVRGTFNEISDFYPAFAIISPSGSFISRTEISVEYDVDNTQECFISFDNNNNYALIYTTNRYSFDPDNRIPKLFRIAYYINGDLDQQLETTDLNCTDGVYNITGCRDNDNNLYLLYNVNSLVGYSGGLSPSNSKTGISVSDIALAKIDKDGNLVWVRQNNAFNYLYANVNPSIIINAEQQPYIIRCVQSSNSEPRNFLITKFNSDGDVLYYNINGVDFGSDLCTYAVMIIDSGCNVRIAYNTDTEGGIVTNVSKLCTSGMLIKYKMNQVNSPISFTHEFKATYQITPTVICSIVNCSYDKLPQISLYNTTQSQTNILIAQDLQYIYHYSSYFNLFKSIDDALELMYVYNDNGTLYLNRTFKLSGLYIDPKPINFTDMSVSEIIFFDRTHIVHRYNSLYYLSDYNKTYDLFTSMTSDSNGNICSYNDVTNYHLMYYSTINGKMLCSKFVNKDTGVFTNVSHTKTLNCGKKPLIVKGSHILIFCLSALTNILNIFTGTLVTDNLKKVPHSFLPSNVIIDHSVQYYSGKFYYVCCAKMGNIHKLILTVFTYESELCIVQQTITINTSKVSYIQTACVADKIYVVCYINNDKRIVLYTADIDESIVFDTTYVSVDINTSRICMDVSNTDIRIVYSDDDANQMKYYATDFILTSSDVITKLIPCKYDLNLYVYETKNYVP